MKRNRRKGVISILALIFLCIFAALSVAYCTTVNSNVLQASNQNHVQSALLQAESGLAFGQYVMQNVSLSASVKDAAMMAALYNALKTDPNIVGNLGGRQIVYDAGAGTITIPAIAVNADGGSFDIVISQASSTSVQVCVNGHARGVSRAVGLTYNLSPGKCAVLDYGIATKSSISLTGNDSITGANSASEASLYSATYSATTAVSMTGNAKIQGDVYVSNPDANISLTGNVSIGGASGAGATAHCHIGVDDAEFPEIDPTVFEPFATNVVDSSTSTSGNKSFKNIRIKAGTNPTFSGNITIKGVVYIEQPNKVQFTGNLNFTGVIVTEDAGENAYTNNTIKFTGNTTSSGVESLPDTAEFHDLRQLPGSFLLAPGFGVSFTGNFGTVNGAMAADSFSFTGNAGGRVNGPIINYSDSQFKLTGNAGLIIDRSKYSGTPPGFVVPAKLSADAGSYVEF
ncbi:MAG: hypothetical protein EHM48_01345 [Planctomycetaceae bacterium]|nr:MAG: hypothetical protein EHM48_01345 [Planctomycetaceae bacterium]